MADDESVLEKLTDEFGGGALLGIKNLNDLKKAFELIDGVDEVRTNLEEAAYPLIPDDEGKGGALNKAIAKSLDLKGKAARNFIPTAGQASVYINEIVQKSADMAHAKSFVMYSFMVAAFSKHVEHLHPGADGGSAEADFFVDIAMED